MTHIEVDLMLFYAAVIEDQTAALDAVTDPLAASMLGGTGLMDGVANIIRTKIEQAQTELDRLIAEDKTWRPA